MRSSHQNDACTKRSQPSSFMIMYKPEMPTSKMETRTCCAKRRSNASKVSIASFASGNSRARKDDGRDGGQAPDPMNQRKDMYGARDCEVVKHAGRSGLERIR